MSDGNCLWKQLSEKQESPNMQTNAGRLLVSEAYHAICGEGSMVGTSAAFIRLAGCNLACVGCDTNHDYRFSDTPEKLALWARSARVWWVVLTGGEPTMQDISGLVDAIQECGMKVAIETNGTATVTSQVDFITVSPKTTDPVQISGDDFKVVMTQEVSADDLRRMKESTDFRSYFVQPLFGSVGSLIRCVEWVKRNPDWRLSAQTHALLGLP